jgi:hypothetical protein
MSNKKYDRMKKEDSMSMNQINGKRLNQQDNKKSLNTIDVIIKYIYIGISATNVLIHQLFKNFVNSNCRIIFLNFC